MNAEKFKQTRKKLGLTQRELASTLGLAKNGCRWIRRIESGKSPASLKIITNLKVLLEKVDLQNAKKKLGAMNSVDQEVLAQVEILSKLQNGGGIK